MTQHSSYIYSLYSSLINLPIDELLQVGNNQIENSNPIPSFDEELLINLCSDAEKIFESEDNILKIEGDVFIVGDIHGSFHDLLRILNYIESNPSKVLFLGDYVDRGEFSLECITLLFALKVEFPDKFFLIRGNHEFDVLCSQYGFKKEILNHHNPSRTKYHNTDSEYNVPNQTNPKQIIYEEKEKSVSTEILCDKYFENHININCYKYSEKLYQSFIKAFSYLPLAALVNTTTFCIHGGLSPLFDSIDKIERSIQRPINEYDSNPLLADILWGDPSDKLKQAFEDNPRGCGKIFNGATVVQFLKNNGLNRILRGHECVNSGTYVMFNEKLITVFSASSYNHEMGNKSGIVKIDHKIDHFESIKFPPIQRLHKVDANYYRVERFDEKAVQRKILLQSSKRKFASFNGIIESDDEIHQNQRQNKLNLMNFKDIFCGRRISFNTGVQYNKAARASLAVPKPISPYANLANFSHLASRDVRPKITKVETSPIPNLYNPLKKKSSL